jgi:predicted HD superfamily hydrolase involved in NAD metabolism
MKLMNNEMIENLRLKIKEALSMDPARYRHTLGVANTAACLAMRYDIDMEKAYIAGLLHDCAKCVPDDIKISECNSAGIDIKDIENKSPYLLHAKLGAYYAKEKYGIEDEDILHSILYHTTGHPNMTPLEEIIFIADYIEPYRNKASNLDKIRSMVFIDIKKAIYEVTKDSLAYLQKTQRPIDPKTENTYEYYRDLLNITQNKEK